jgi:choline dehydrogenase-like flavoprotein
MDTKDFEIIIIGAGVCGALAAYKLSKEGYKVLIIEAGLDKTTERLSLSGNYATELYKGPAAPYKKIATSDILGPDVVGYQKNPDGKNYYYDDSSGSFRSGFLRIVGGSTWHFLGNVPRFIPNDFKLHTEYKIGVDWPLTYDDLEGYYCEAEKELGVSGDHEEWNGYLGANRSEPYPMTKIWQSYGDQPFLEKIHGNKFCNKEILVKSTPQARNSTIYDGRPACAGNSTCVPICPIQAKYDATVHIKKALELKAVLLSNCVVSKLNTDSNGVILSIEYIDWVRDKNNPIKIDTTNKKVILATNAIETPRLLLISDIANSSKQVGKNLMDHLQGYTLAESIEPVFPFRGPLTTSGIDAFRDGEHRNKFAAFRMSIGNDGWGRNSSPQNVLWENLNKNVFGIALREELQKKVTRLSRISFSTEMLPQEYNSVSLSNNLKDELGLPKPKISITLDDYNKDAFKFAYQLAKDIYTKLEWNVKHEEFLEEYLYNYSGAGHIIGTTRMGNNPKTSVVDPFGKAHEHPNLFIVGPSVFPTSGTANPTLTAAALTLRTIKSIICNS